MTEEDTPYIEPPAELDDDPRNGLACFIDGNRICGPDCMAFTTQGSESPVLNDQQKHCVAIVSIERLGRYAGGLFSFLKKADADAKRNSSSPILDPKGNK